MQLKAPCDAQVLKLNVEPGELAGPNSVQPAIVVADTVEFCVRVFVEELDAPKGGSWNGSHDRCRRTA